MKEARDARALFEAFLVYMPGGTSPDSIIDVWSAAGSPWSRAKYGASRNVRQLQRRKSRAPIAESGNDVQTGAGLVERAGATMEQIIRSVTQVNAIMRDVAAVTDEQRRGITEVSRAVSQMDQVTQQNAALVEESASAASSLGSQAEELKRTVARFQLH